MRPRIGKTPPTVYFVIFLSCPRYINYKLKTFLTVPYNVINANCITKSVRKPPKSQPTKKSKPTPGFTARIPCTYYTSTYQEIHYVPSCTVFLILVKSNDFSYISKSFLILKYNWTLPSTFLIRRSVSAFFMAFFLIMLDSFIVASCVELISRFDVNNLLFDFSKCQII